MKKETKKIIRFYINIIAIGVICGIFGFGIFWFDLLIGLSGFSIFGSMFYGMFMSALLSSAFSVLLIKSYNGTNKNSNRNREKKA